VALYEVVLRFEDGDEVRLTERDGYEAGKHVVIGSRRFVVFGPETAVDPRAKARFVLEPADAVDGAEQQADQRRALFREVNERIAHLGEASTAGERMFIHCECGSTDCEERIELSKSEYERLRSSPTRFAVAAGHDRPAVEGIVEESGGFAIVEE
jgi:hypothetical protein